MSDQLFERLAAPFAPEQVSWRVGVSNKKKRQRETGDNNAKATKGQVLAYIDARDVMDRLDEVCGPENWQDRYPHVDKKTVCEIDIWVEGRGWVTKADGAGDSDIEAEKGALSDAFKRAAVRWGIGRYLYHLPTPWVDLDEREQIPQAEMRKLEAILRGKAPPRQAPAAEDVQPEQTGLYIACAAAIDMAAEQGGKGGLDAWANDNTVSMERIKAENLAVYQAVKRHYASRLKPLMPKHVPTNNPPADEFGLQGDQIPEFA